MAGLHDGGLEDPTPPDARAAQLPDDPDDEIFPRPEDAVEVVPPVDVVTIDHAEVGLEPPQVDPGSASADLPATRDVVATLRVHGLFRMPDLTAVAAVDRVARGATATVTAGYFDTDDLRLARWGASLRRLEGGHEEGWHLHLPVGADGSGSDDVRAPLGDGQLPRALSDLVTAFARNGEIRPVVTVVTERTPHVLHDAGGAVFAEVVDDTVSVLDGEHLAARFRELSVESLVEGDPAQVVVDALVAAGAVPGTTPVELTALGPAVQEPPDVPEPQIVGPADPAGAAVTAHLRRHARALLLQDVRVRRDLPDSVHQMRVAARRLRSGLKAFEPMLDVQWAESLRAELGWIAGELGVSRDTEVLQERIDLHADEVGEEFAPLIRAVVDPALSAQWRDAREHALAAMVSTRYRDFLDRLVDAARNPRLNHHADAPAEQILPGLVDKAWRKLSKEVALLKLDGPSDDWHEARIRAKKARYAAEAVAPVMGEHVKRFAKALSGVTEILGEHQDAWVAQHTLKSLAAGPDIDGLSGFSLGLLHEFEFEQELLARNDFVDLWPSVKQAHKKARLR